MATDYSYWPEGAPHDGEYQTFTGDYDQDKAAEKFIARYHQGPPAFVFWCPDACGMLRAGPVREGER